MKKIVYFLLALVSLVVLGILSMGSSAKTVIANAKDANDGYSYYSKTTFDHIDIESEASFTYYVDGKPVKVDINFYNDKANLSKINIYKKNKDGTLTEIPVKGNWQNQSGSTDKEYRISGTFDRYYDSSAKDKKEVVYVVKFTLSVTINGVSQDLVYTEDYSYSSSNNVCPGNSSNKGIDVEITGTKLEEFFSSSVKIIKNVENADDATFTFNVSAVNSSVNFNKDVQITTSSKTGFITLGGLQPGEKYIISEINIPEGYELVGSNEIEITVEKNKTIEVTFNNRAETVDVSGTKTWDDKDNQDGIRPTEITVKLLKNGVEFKEVKVNDTNGWKYSFNDLDKYENGKEITYTVEEVSVDGYETVINGYDITNTHKPETVDVSGTKTWDDKDNQDGIRPTEITVKLLKNGVEFKEVKVNDTNGWKYSFNDLDKYENGKEIEYTIIEDEVEGYSTIINGYNITNVHETEETIVSGVKTWNDSNNQDGIRPDSITVNLLKNGVQFKSIEVTKENDWSYKFENLAMYENGKKLLIR